VHYIVDRFFQLSQVIPGDILSAFGFRPIAEAPYGCINGFRIGYAVAEGPYAIDIHAF
jgi:hypothetical protein